MYETFAMASISFLQVGFHIRHFYCNWRVKLNDSSCSGRGRQLTPLTHSGLASVSRSEWDRKVMMVSITGERFYTSLLLHFPVQTASFGLKVGSTICHCKRLKYVATKYATLSGFITIDSHWMTSRLWQITPLRTWVVCRILKILGVYHHGGNILGSWVKHGGQYVHFWGTTITFESWSWTVWSSTYTTQ